ncbi:TetR/AcrR family transcriptional regulator [Cohaesibacter haloalkalitolerans]|uniref:TetR/AcrR family transcriptional regulator n=1 Tax=Cohaesibacter haloalkalitolerans TaxID=1162980 RepID=UPI000E65B524|nr:TetR/AcrR family transcriptional regulator [Cohaesibacter haloalkalitolerans]
MKAAEKYRLKKTTILGAAEQLFLGLGYMGTTMDAVADEAGVTKQTVYRYFPSKVALFSALIGHFDEDEMEFFFGEAAVAEELRSYGLAFLSRHMQPRNLALFRLMIAESHDSGELGDIFRTQAQPHWSGRLIAYLRPHVPEGRAEGLAQFYNALLLSKRTNLLMGGGDCMSPDEIRLHVDQALDLFLNGASLNR